MKKIVLWLMSTLTALVLLFGYHTSTSSQASANGGSSVVTPITSGTSGTTSGTASSGGSAGTSSSAGSPSAGTGSTSSTVTGTAADTPYGPVQVQLTVTARKITNVSVIQYPDQSGRDQEINAQALPILVQETMQAQSARIDMVSGATYTSDGYLQSLQSALDRAGL